MHGVPLFCICCIVCRGSCMLSDLVFLRCLDMCSRRMSRGMEGLFFVLFLVSDAVLG